MTKCAASMSGRGTTADFYQYVHPFFGICPQTSKRVSKGPLGLFCCCHTFCELKKGSCCNSAAWNVFDRPMSLDLFTKFKRSQRRAMNP